MLRTDTRRFTLLTVLLVTLSAIFAAALLSLAEFNSATSLLRALVAIAVAIFLPTLLLYRRRKGGWFHPSVLPAAYLAFVLLGPTAYVLVTNEALGRLKPGFVTFDVVAAAALLFLAYLAAVWLGLLKPKRRTDSGSAAETVQIDHQRLRTWGRSLLAFALGARLLLLLLTRGLPYGHAQRDYGLRAQLAAIVSVVAIPALLLIVVANLALRSKPMTRTDWSLFGAFFVLTIAGGGRSALVGGVIVLFWGTLRQRRVPWVRITVAGLAILILLAGVTAARQGRGYIPDSQSVATSQILTSVASPIYLTARVQDLVPSAAPYQGGSTYIAAIKRQVPGVFGRLLFGPPDNTGSRAYRRLAELENPNAGVGFALPAEAYLNFGTLGVGLVGLLLGALFAFGWRHLRMPPRRVTDVFYLVLVMTLPMSLRSDAAGAIKLVLYASAIAWLAFRFSRRPASQKIRPATTPAREPSLQASILATARISATAPVSSTTLDSPSIRPRSAAPRIPRSYQGPTPGSEVRAHDPRPFTRGHRPAVASTPFATPSPALTPTPRPPRHPQPPPISGRFRRWSPPRWRTTVRTAGARVVGAIADQAAASLTNYVILFAALHYLSVSGIGVFTFAYTGAMVTTILVRSLVLEPLTIRYSTDAGPERRRASAEAAGAALAIGFILFLFAAAIVAPLVPLDNRSLVLSLAVTTPVLLVQDAYRFHFFAGGRLWAAALNDVACLISTLVAAAVLVLHGTPTVAQLIFIWGVGRVVGAILGLVQTHLRPSPRAAWRWLRAHSDLGPRLAGEIATGRVAGQISLALVGAFAGLHALGELAAARTLVAPATTVTTSVVTFGVPEAARLHNRRADHLTRFSAAVSIFLPLAIMLFAAVLFAAPDWIGELLAGRNWDTAKLLLLPVAIWAAANGARQGSRIALRVLQRPRLILRLSLVTAVAILASTMPGAYLAGASGAAWAFAISSGLAAILWWLAYRRATPDASVQESPPLSGTLAGDADHDPPSLASEW